MSFQLNTLKRSTEAPAVDQIDTKTAFLTPKMEVTYPGNFHMGGPRRIAFPLT